jgi:hypothetical protein
MNNNEQNAKIFIEAIKTITLKSDNLDNLETYLSYHFTEWLEKFADTPVKLAYELKHFAEMEIY